MFISWLLKSFKCLPARQVVRSRPFRRTIGFDLLETRSMPAFLSPTAVATGANPAGIAVGDFNGDGKSDMAVVNQTYQVATGGSVSILISNADGTGTFQPKIDYTTLNSAIDATTGDFNKDGKLDLAVSGPGSMSVLLGNGDGTFAAPVLYSSGGGSSVKTGDFNKDGNLDIATTTSGNGTVLLGNGDGTFQARRDVTFAGNATNLVVGDFNRDGFLDMATSNTSSVGTITLLKGHGDGSFDPASNIYAFSAPVYLAAGDFNQDGYDDFAVANSYAATSMSIIMNNGDGTYAAPVTYGINQTGYEIEVADFNNDGNQDFAVRGGSEYMVGFGKGDGTFFAPVSYATPYGRFEAGTHGDFNGDGAVDFAYPSGGGVVVVMNANDNVTSLAGAVGFSIATPASTTSGAALPMTVSVLDADGNIATGFLGTVFVTTSDQAATSSTTFTYIAGANPITTTGIAYTFTAADSGVHTFNGSVRLVTLGDQTVTVSSPLLPASSKTVNVTPAVKTLNFSAPTVSTAGDSFSFTVTAIDSIGGLGTGYTSTIHFSSSDVQAGLPANYTFTPEDAGVHTFTVSLKTAGSVWLAATEVGGTVSGGSFVTVTPAAVASLTLAGPGGSIGVSRPVTVVANDVYGNNVVGYNGTVHFTSSDAAAVLPPDTTLVNGSAIVNVTFMTVGTETITATDVATASVTGTMFSNATPPVAALFAVSGYPATSAGAAQNFTVTVRDTIGQVATGYAGTVYFSSSDVQAGLPASYTFTAADAGVHTFSATFKTAGTQSISVQDYAGGLSGSQSGIAVSSAAFASYRLSVPNGADSKGHILVTAGEAISLTVKATDAYGNLVTSYKGKVKFSSTDALAGLPPTYSFTATDAGIHTFTLDLRTTTPNSVVWSVSVVDSANAATLAAITNFEVSNAAAAKFVLNIPTNITAGTPFTVKVSVLDAYGNSVKNYFGTVHFGNTAGLTGLPADYSFNNVDSGVHTFTLTLNTTGNQTLSVLDTANNLLSATSVVSVKAATATGGGGGGTGGGGTGGGGGGSGGGGKKV